MKRRDKALAGWDLLAEIGWGVWGGAWHGRGVKTATASSAARGWTHETRSQWRALHLLILRGQVSHCLAVWQGRMKGCHEAALLDLNV